MSETGTSIPDAETLVHLSEVLEVPVNELLDEQKPQESAELSDVAKQLAQLNELTALRMQREKELISKVKTAVVILLVFGFVAAIFPHWLDTFHRFGQNLYHMLNP